MKNLNVVHLNGLRALESVGRLGSLQAAADELGVTIGAVSQQVIKAENQLGHAVFARTPKGMLATDFGRPVLARLSEGFHLLSQAVAIGKRRDDARLTISVAPVFAARWLVPRLDRFSALYPDMRLRIDATSRLVDLDADDVDMAIRVGRGVWAGTDAELLSEQIVFPVCTPDVAGRLKVPADILACPAIIDGPSVFSWDVWLREAGLGGQELKTLHVFNDASLCLDATMSGQGVMLAWQTLASSALEQGRLVEPFRIRARTGLGHYIVTRANEKPPEKVRRFSAWLRSEIEQEMLSLKR
jgi:DNA-binding transcriptional LysR family regulator